jgi:spermidine synthase
LKLLKTLYLLAFIEGFSILILEICFGKMLYPILGEGITVWAVVLSSTMTGLSIGYFVGGTINHHLLKRVIVGLFVVITIYMLNLTSIINWGYEISYSKPTNTILILISSLIFPLFIMWGAIPTLLIKLILSFDSNFKKSIITSNVFSFSTLGSIISGLLISFLLLNNLGINVSILIVSFLCFCALIIFVLLFDLSKKILVLMAIVFSSNAYVIINSQKNIIKKNTSDIEVLEFDEGMQGQILIADLNENNIKSRYMFVNRMPQSFKSFESNLEFPYLTYIRRLISSNSKSALLLGLGGGSIVEILLDKNIKTDICEFDSRVIDYAKKYFIRHDKVNTANFTNSDARYFIKKNSNKKYDQIIFDLFKGENPPSHVFTKESLVEIKKIMNEEGSILINMIGNISERSKTIRAIIKTLLLNNWEVKVYQIKNVDNVIIWSTPYKFDKNLSDLNKHLEFNINSLNFNDVPLLTDDKPNLEFLNKEISEYNRKWYYERNTLIFKKKGIPFFK